MPDNGQRPTSSVLFVDDFQFDPFARLDGQRFFDTNHHRSVLHGKHVVNHHYKFPRRQGARPIPRHVLEAEKRQPSDTA